LWCFHGWCFSNTVKTDKTDVRTSSVCPNTFNIIIIRCHPLDGFHQRASNKAHTSVQYRIRMYVVRHISLIRMSVVRMSVFYQLLPLLLRYHQASGRSLVYDTLYLCVRACIKENHKTMNKGNKKGIREKWHEEQYKIKSKLIKLDVCVRALRKC
jgi:hypothetical protein